MVRSGRPLRVRRSSWPLVAALLGLAVAPFPQAPATASCAAPYLEVRERLVLERGATVVIEGRAFVDGCRDAMTCPAFGCGSCEYDDPPPVPYKEVGLRLVQRDRTWNLDVADAETAENNRQGWVTWTFDVPAGAQPGPARLRAEHAQPVRVRIR